MDAIRVNGTLSVVPHTSAGDLHVVIERRGGGLVRVEVDELRGLLGALRATCGMLALSLERQQRRAGAAG